MSRGPLGGSDARDALVVESIPADMSGKPRYAVRRPGTWARGGDYIVSTNNVEEGSYNDQNVHDAAHPWLSMAAIS